MAFVNEIISEQDFEKYALAELKKSYDPWRWRAGRPQGASYSWTIDRDRDIYFMLVEIVHDSGGRSGLMEPTRRRIFVLSIHGQRVEIALDVADETSNSFKTVPYRQVWELVAIKPEQLADTSREAIIKILKEALAIYGYRGAHSQIPNTIVEFKF
jgi:hypothetical protein